MDRTSAIVAGRMIGRTVIAPSGATGKVRAATPGGSRLWVRWDATGEVTQINAASVEVI